MGNGQPSKIGEKNPKFVRNGQTYNNCGKWSNSLNLWEMLKHITIVGNGQNIQKLQKMVKQPKFEKMFKHAKFVGNDQKSEKCGKWSIIQNW